MGGCSEFGVRCEEEEGGRGVVESVADGKYPPPTDRSKSIGVEAPEPTPPVTLVAVPVLDSSPPVASNPPPTFFFFPNPPAPFPHLPPLPFLSPNSPVSPLCPSTRYSGINPSPTRYLPTAKRNFLSVLPSFPIRGRGSTGGTSSSDAKSFR